MVTGTAQQGQVQDPYTVFWAISTQTPNSQIKSSEFKFEDIS